MADCISLWKDESNVIVTGSMWERIHISIRLHTWNRFEWAADHVCAYFYCNASLHWQPLRHRQRVQTSMDRHMHTHFHITQGSYPESICANWIDFYMLLPQEPLQDFSFWLRQRIGVIDPPAAAWRESLPAKMEPACSHLVPLLQRPLARCGLWGGHMSTVSSQTQVVLLDIDWAEYFEM